MPFSQLVNPADPEQDPIPKNPYTSAAPKVLHLTAIDDSISLILARQLRYLRERGFEVHAACSPGPNTADISSALGVPIHPISISRHFDPKSDLRSIQSLVKLFRRERFDIVHLHFPKASLLGAIAARLARVPIVVLTARPIFQPHMPWPQRRLFMAIERFTVALCTHVLAQNPDDATYYPALGICPAHKISPLGNGIDLARFNPDDFSVSDRARLREDLGIPVNALVVGMVGRYTPEKGYYEFFGAIQQLVEAHPRLHFITIGGAHDSERDPLPSDLPERLGLAGRGSQLGFREDIPRLLSVMDVLLFPSHREACPRAPMEAAAMGLPIVCSDLRGCRWSIEEGVNGFFVPVGDTAGFARRVAQLLRSNKLRHDLGVLSRALAQRRFDERLIFDKVDDCYRRQLATYMGQAYAAAEVLDD